MACVDTLKELWWLAGLVAALIGLVWRSAIKTNKLMEQVQSVKSHDEQIREIKRDTEELKGKIELLSQEMADHVVGQKHEISVMMKTLFTLVDAVKELSQNNTEVIAAHKELREHVVEK